jgi:hypothetical protein
MSYADEVRAHCGNSIVEPARARGEDEVSIRAGDVHQDLGYRNRLPLVCSALGAAIFEEQYRVRRIAVEGPLNGSNTLFRFSVLP